MIQLQKTEDRVYVILPGLFFKRKQLGPGWHVVFIDDLGRKCFAHVISVDTDLGIKAHEDCLSFPSFRGTLALNRIVSAMEEFKELPPTAIHTKEGREMHPRIIHVDGGEKKPMTGWVYVGGIARYVDLQDGLWVLR